MLDLNRLPEYEGIVNWSVTTVSFVSFATLPFTIYVVMKSSKEMPVYKWFILQNVFSSFFITLWNFLWRPILITPYVLGEFPRRSKPYRSNIWCFTNSLDYAIGPARYFGDVGMHYMHEIYMIFLAHCVIWRILSISYLYHAMKKATKGFLFKEVWHIGIFGLALYGLVAGLYVLLYLSRVSPSHLEEIYLPRDSKLKVRIIRWAMKNLAALRHAPH